MKNHLKFLFYIELDIRGDGIKRFLNICRKDGIVFSHIKYSEKDDNGITVRISRKDFFKLRKCIRATGVHIKVIKKAYPRYYIFRYRGHYSFLAGIIIMFICLKILGMFIWQVDFYGNYKYTDETLRRYMSDCGVSNARLLKGIDCDYLEEKIRNDFDVTWACVAVKGSRVLVYIKENYSGDYSNKSSNDSNNDDISDDTGKSIYSQYDGNVFSIITREGTPIVHAGDNVSKGQLLIEGMVHITDDSGTEIAASEVDADADILIRTVIPYEDEIEVDYEDKLYTGRKRYRLILENKYVVLKAGIMFNNKVSYDTMIESHRLYMPGDIDSGFTCGYETQFEYNSVMKKRNEEECNTLLKDRLDMYIKHIEQKGVQIIDCRVNIDTSGSYYRCSGELEVLLNPDTDIDK